MLFERKFVVIRRSKKNTPIYQDNLELDSTITCEIDEGWPSFTAASGRIKTFEKKRKSANKKISIRHAIWEELCDAGHKLGKRVRRVSSKLRNRSRTYEEISLE